MKKIVSFRTTASKEQAVASTRVTTHPWWSFSISSSCKARVLTYLDFMRSYNYDISSIQLRSVFEWGRSRRVFTAKKDCSSALLLTAVCSTYPGAPIRRGLPSDKGNQHRKETTTAGHTSLVMEDEKSTLSVAERLKRVVLMIILFYCPHLRTDPPEKN
jgi:hypothetical protein